MTVAIDSGFSAQLNAIATAGNPGQYVWTLFSDHLGGSISDPGFAAPTLLDHSLSGDPSAAGFLNFTPTNVVDFFDGQFAEQDYAGADALAFVGVGVFGLETTGDLSLTLTFTNPSATWSGPISLGGSASVTYNFDGPGPPVPEPSSWSLLIAGFGIVGQSVRMTRRATA